MQLTVDLIIGILDGEGVDCRNGTKFTALSLDMPQMSKFGQLMYQYDNNFWYLKLSIYCPSSVYSAKTLPKQNIRNMENLCILNK